MRARVAGIGAAGAAVGLTVGIFASQRVVLTLIAATLLAMASVGAVVAVLLIDRQSEARADTRRLHQRIDRLTSITLRAKKSVTRTRRTVRRMAQRTERRVLRQQARRERAVLLTDLAQRFRTDKWGVHFYTPHYERHLRHLREAPFTLLEIGVGGYDRYQQGGGSLRMWKNFFHLANIVGLDIEDKSFVDEDRVRTVIGSQTDEGVLHRIIEEEGAPLVVIDDGSHVPADIIATFNALFPLLPDGAIYAIEDTQTSYWPEWGGKQEREAVDTTMWLVKQLIDGLNHEEYVDEDYTPSYTDRHVVAVHCYHNLVIIEKGSNIEGSNKRTVLSDRYRTV